MKLITKKNLSSVPAAALLAFGLLDSIGVLAAPVANRPRTDQLHLDLCLQPRESSRSSAHCWYALSHGVHFASEVDQAEARLRVAADYLTQGNDAEAWPLLDQVIRALTVRSGSKERLSEALAARGQIYLRRWEIDAGREDLLTAAALARQAGKPRLEVAVLLLLSRLDLGIGQPQAAEGHLEKILNLYGKPTPQLEEDYRNWLEDRGSVLPDFNTSVTQIALQAVSGGDPTGGSQVPVDDIEVDYHLYLNCLKFGTMPGWKDVLCQGPAARQRIVDTLRLAHRVATLAEPLQEKTRATLEADAASYCPLLDRSDILFDLADLNELSGNAVLAAKYRSEAKDFWKRTSGVFVTQNDEAMMNMAWSIASQIFPERKRPEPSPGGPPAAGPLMKIYEESERPPSSGSLIRGYCARDASSSSAATGPAGLATMPETLQNRLIGGYESLSLPQALAAERVQRAREAAKNDDTGTALVLYQEAIELAGTRTLDPSAISVDLAARSARLFGEFVRFLVENGRANQAFDVAERSRSLAFNDSVRADLPRMRTQNAEALKTLRELETRIVILQGDIQSRKQSPSEYPAMMGGLENELRRLTTERSQRIGQLRSADPETAALFYGESTNLATIRGSLLPPDTAMVAYFLSGDLSLAWVINKDSAELVRLRKSPAEIESLVKNFQGSLLERSRQQPTAWRPLAEELYDELFRPLEPKLKQSSVILVPHGVLHTLPFAALADARSGRYAGETWTLSMTPSASALQFLGRHVTPLGKRILAFGNPDSSLPFAAKEAQAIAGIFGASPVLGMEATASRLQRDAGSADVVHLAVHASYDDAGGRLELAPKGPTGLLRATDILRLNLAETNLVVLSACSTATGPIGGGDTMASLNRAFLIAGSPTVLATLWPVADDASSALMVSFYRHLLEDPTRGYPDALRRAQKDVRSQAKWASPYFWAGFAVHGYVGRAPAVTIKPAMTTTTAPAPPLSPASTKLRTIFEDSFEDNRNNWYQSLDREALASVLYGRYFFGCKANEWRFATMPISLQDNGDFELRTTVTKIKGDDQYFFGLIWELDDSQNFSNFAITGDGRVAVTQKTAGTFRDFIDTRSMNPAVRRGNASNELKVVRRGSSVRFYLNGVEIHSMTAQPAFGSRMGFLAYGDMLLAFEEIVVSEFSD